MFLRLPVDLYSYMADLDRGSIHMYVHRRSYTHVRSGLYVDMSLFEGACKYYGNK